MSRLLTGLALLLLGPPLALEAAGPLTLAAGDRVVLLGNTLIEREQRYGYWELALVRRHPGRKIIFRNLGWSGDTVLGHSRAGFGDQAAGFRHLKDHVLALEPTVILLGYGSNESFDGPAGLPGFQAGCKTLLSALAPAKARIVWLSPLRQEKLPAPLPDPVEQNKNLALYRDSIAETARQNDQGFVDLFTLLHRKDAPPLTDNGIHLTARGYWESSLALEQGLGLKESPWRVTLKADGGLGALQGTTVRPAAQQPGWQLTDDVLPFPLPPEANRWSSGFSRSSEGRRPAKAGTPTVPPSRQRVLKIEGLPPGKHTLTIDSEPVATADAAEWAKGVVLTKGKEFAQTEQLRQAIIAKNLLYFHRWRPQNETYLFGFRKREQGQNAVEIPQFDPLVAKQEEEIVKLSKPLTHTYSIKPGDDR